MKSLNNATAFLNVTLSNAEPFYFSVWWNVLFGVSAISILISLYLFICLTLYLMPKNTLLCGNRKNLSKMTTVSKSIDFNVDQDQEVQSARTNRSQNAENSKRLKHIDSKKSKTSKCASQVLHIVLLVTLSLNLMRGVVELLFFFVEKNSDYACNVLARLMISFTGFAIHGNVVFLWLRQHIFYSNPVVKHLRPKGKKYISLITYLEMIVTLSVCLGLHLWWRDYTTADGLCRPIVGSQRVSPVVAFGLVAFSTVTIQISLTFLFVYPLLAHRKQVKKLKIVTQKSRSAARQLDCIKRALIGATIGITTDIVGSFVSILLPEDLPLYVLSVIYELDISLNILCILYTYKCWKDIVFPWRKKERKHHELKLLFRSSQSQIE